MGLGAGLRRDGDSVDEVWTPAVLGHRAAMAISLQKIEDRERALREKKHGEEKRDGGKKGSLKIWRWYIEELTRRENWGPSPERPQNSWAIGRRAAPPGRLRHRPSQLLHVLASR